MQSSRRRGRGQHRILYWFRTPPAVRVGRAAIDEDAIHLLEQHNPDVQFDWTRILKQPMTSEAQSHEPDRPVARPRQEPPRSASSSPRHSRPPSRPPPPAPAEIDTTTESETPEQLASQDVTVINPQRDQEGPPEPEERQTAALAHLGAEGLSRLRARYAEVLARITDRPLDETAREELKARAERLNPDAWVTDEEVRQGLEQYEAVFESLRSVVGHPRRRRRRRG